MKSWLITIKYSQEQVPIESTDEKQYTGIIKLAASREETFDIWSLINDMWNFTWLKFFFRAQISHILKRFGKLACIIAEKLQISKLCYESAIIGFKAFKFIFKIFWRLHFFMISFIIEEKYEKFHIRKSESYLY